MIPPQVCGVNTRKKEVQPDEQVACFPKWKV